MSLFSKMVAFVPENRIVLNGNAHAIIRKDIEKNYVGRGIDASVVCAAFDIYKIGGGLYFESERNLIIYKRLSDGSVEFHNAHAGNSTQLVNAVASFLRYIRSDGICERAITHYDNEKINDLLPRVPFRSELKRIDDGLDRTFAAIFFLREEL